MFMRVQLNSKFDREMKVCYVTQVLTQRILASTRCVLTTYSNLTTRNRIYLKSASRRAGQDRNCLENYVCLIVGPYLTRFPKYKNHI